MKTRFDELNEKIEECKEFAKTNGLHFVGLTSDDNEVFLSIKANSLSYGCMLKGLLEENPILAEITKEVLLTVKNNENED